MVERLPKLQAVSVVKALGHAIVLGNVTGCSKDLAAEPGTLVVKFLAKAMTALLHQFSHPILLLGGSSYASLGCGLD